MNRSRSRYLLYIPLVLVTIFYLIPLYVMLVTGFKSFDEISLQTMWSLPKSGLHFDNFIEALSKLAPYFKNSIIMVVPAAIISSILGSLNGYILSKWKFPGADLIFPAILFGMFIPYQSILIPQYFITGFLGWIGFARIQHRPDACNGGNDIILC